MPQFPQHVTVGPFLQCFLKRRESPVTSPVLALVASLCSVFYIICFPVTFCLKKEVHNLKKQKWIY